VSFHALRDYVPGDDRRHIHWKTTARTNKLMVRQFEETRRAHLAVSLSINTDEYASEEEFEMAISAAASIGRQAIREQRELDVLTQKGPLRCETGKNMLDDMTRIVGAPMRRTAVDLARTLADTVPNASVVFFVVGSNVSATQLRSAAASVPPGVRTLAVRVEAGAASSRANIADLTVLTLGDLADLGIVLRKAAA
jgi:uracil phosphoribosyltransferase